MVENWAAPWAVPSADPRVGCWVDESAGNWAAVKAENSAARWMTWSAVWTADSWAGCLAVSMAEMKAMAMGVLMAGHLEPHWAASSVSLWAWYWASRMAANLAALKVDSKDSGSVVKMARRTAATMAETTAQKTAVCWACWMAAHSVL
jgi:hypothetical protein